MINKTSYILIQGYKPHLGTYNGKVESQFNFQFKSCHLS